MRVGFVLGQVGWTGGVNYYRNLFTAIHLLPDSKLEIVIFTGNKSDVSHFEGLVEIVRTPLLDRGSVSWWINKLTGRVLFGREYLLYLLLRRCGIKLLSHVPLLWRGAPIPSLGWIPDFQHVKLPDYFGEKALREHNDQIKRIIHNSDALLLSSRDAMSDLHRHFPEDPLPTSVLRFVSCLAAQSGDLPSQTVLAQGYGLSRPWFHVPNQFWAHKNHGIIVEVLALLKKSGACPLVVSTGDTHDYRHPGYFPGLMEEVRKHGLEKDFLALGMVPYADVVALMRDSVAVINPSLFEGWSTSVEEAKAMGKTVILSDIAVHREQKPERGVYFDTEEPEQLAKIMMDQLSSFDESNEAYHQDRAKQVLMETRETFAKQYEEIVLSVI